MMNEISLVRVQGAAGGCRGTAFVSPCRLCCVMSVVCRGAGGRWGVFGLPGPYVRASVCMCSARHNQNISHVRGELGFVPQPPATPRIRTTKSAGGPFCCRGRSPCTQHRTVYGGAGPQSPQVSLVSSSSRRQKPRARPPTHLMSARDPRTTSRPPSPQSTKLALPPMARRRGRPRLTPRALVRSPRLVPTLCEAFAVRTLGR